jgi:hypothetical protein
MKMQTLLKSLAASALLSISGTGFTQSLDSKGTEFWLAFMENGDREVPELSFFMSSEVDTSVTITIPELSMSDTINLSANVAVRYGLPNTLETTTFDTIDSTGISVSSVEEISVYGLNRIDESTDAFLALPTDVIGTDYIVLAHGHSVSETLRSEFLIVATEDNTTVRIEASPLDTSLVAPIEVTLNRGQTYQHRSGDDEDVSGTRISSNNPISVFGGHQCANIPDENTFFCDHLVEQLPPISTWGTQFIATPLANRTMGDTFKIIASNDNTQITINSDSPITLNSGELYETILTEAALITSNNPILVGQYSNGTNFDNVTSDPFMMLIPPFEQFLDNYTFSTPTQGFRENFVNIVVRTNDISSLQLDSSSIDLDEFTVIPNTEYSSAQIELELGSHNLSGALAGVYVYGYDSFDSYGYPGGLSLSSVAEVESVALSEEFEVVDGEACFTASVSDINTLPLQDIRVDFLVDLIEGFDTTDENGVAEFCVEAGDSPEEYVVTATVGNESVMQTVTPPSEEESEGGGAIDFTFLLFSFLGLLGFRRKTLQRQ